MDKHLRPALAAVAAAVVFVATPGLADDVENCRIADLPRAQAIAACTTVVDAARAQDGALSVQGGAALLRRGALHYMAGDHASADADFSLVLEERIGTSDADAIDAGSALAAIRSADGVDARINDDMPEEMKERLREMLANMRAELPYELNPDTFRALQLRSDTRLAAGDLDGAIADQQPAVRLAEPVVDTFPIFALFAASDLYALQFAAGDDASALATQERVAAWDDGEDHFVGQQPYLEDRGRILCRLGRHDEAIEAFDAFYRLNNRTVFVAALQEGLAEEDRLGGAVDGIYGKGTRGALEGWARAGCTGVHGEIAHIGDIDLMER